MLKDEILEKIFANKEMQTIPIGCQSTAVSVFEDVLEELRKDNPYVERMNFLQNYQQGLQQPILPAQTPVSNQMSALGKMVDSINVVKATDIPMDGNAYYFPKADGTEVYCKQWLQNGTTRILTFKPVFEDNPNNDHQTQKN